VLSVAGSAGREFPGISVRIDETEARRATFAHRSGLGDVERAADDPWKGPQDSRRTSRTPRAGTGFGPGADDF